MKVEEVIEGDAVEVVEFNPLNCNNYQHVYSPHCSPYFYGTDEENF